MSEIPEDVMAAATLAAREQQLFLAAIYGTGFMGDGMIDPIARAIMVERERCAQIAEAEDFLPKHVTNAPECMVARDIAAAIRDGKEAPQ